jgi:hypothetical protein
MCFFFIKSVPLFPWGYSAEILSYGADAHKLGKPPSIAAFDDIAETH